MPMPTASDGGSLPFPRTAYNGESALAFGPMSRLAAWVVLALGTLVLIGGVVGAVNGIRDHDLDAPLPRLLVMLLVVVAMRRAAPKARAVHIR
jgi:hypothetical protein